MLIGLQILAGLFGLFELTTNIVYLTTKDGIQKAYKQHREIPAAVTEERMCKKVITMLAVGCIFLLISGCSLFRPVFAGQMIAGLFGCYALYTWVEAIVYKKHLLGYVLAVLISVITALAISTVV